MIPGGIKKGSEVHFLSDFCHFDNLTCQNEPVKATLTPPKIALKQYLGVVRPPESVFFLTFRCSSSQFSLHFLDQFQICMTPDGLPCLPPPFSPDDGLACHRRFQRRTALLLGTAMAAVYFLASSAYLLIFMVLVFSNSSVLISSFLIVL